MPLNLNTCRDIKALLLSDRIAYKGSEVMSVAAIAAELDREVQGLVLAQRVVPRQSPVAPPPPPKAEDDED